MFEIGEYACVDDDLLEIELINSCNSEETAEITIALEDFDCITRVEDVLSSVQMIFDIHSQNLIIKDLPAVNTSLEIYNTQGILCFKTSIEGSNMIKDLSFLQTGMYICRIKSLDQRKAITKKIFVK